MLPRAASSWMTRARQVAAVARLRPFDTTTSEGRSQERYRRIILATTSGLLARALGTLASLVTVPLLLSYLGKERFGLWSAAMSLVAWLGLLDLGISNGLVNAVSEAYGRNDKTAAGRFVCSAAVVLASVAGLAAIVLTVVGPRIAWDAILGVAGKVPKDLVTSVVLAAAAVFLAGLPLAFVQSVYVGYQTLHVANLFAAAGAIATVGVVWLGIQTGVSLPGLILAMGAANLTVTVASLLVLTRVLMPWLTFRLSRVSWSAAQRLSKTSVPLFLFQVGGLAVNQSQFILLARVSSLTTVAEYAVLLRVVQILSSLILLSTNAFVPSYREAAERGDRPWVKASFRRMLWVRMGLAAAGGAVLVAFGDAFVRVWLRRADVGFDLAVWLGVAVFITAATWVTAHSDLLTVLDRIWVQVVLVMVNGGVTIGLTLFLAPRYGVLGALVALALTTVVGWTWVLPPISRCALERPT